MDVRGYGFGGLANIAEVGFMIVIERRGDADDEGVHVLSMGVLVGGPKALRGGSRNLRFRDAVNIRPAIIQGLNLFGVDIESSYGEAGFIEEKCQWQSDIAKANDSYFCGMRLDACE